MPLVICFVHVEHIPSRASIIVPSRTRGSYAREWERCEAYAFEHGASALPASPLVVAAYMAHLDAEGLPPSSLDVAMRRSSIGIELHELLCPQTISSCVT